MPRATRRLLLGALVAAALLSLVQGLRTALSDPEGSQDNQWGPSRALLHHTDPYAAYLDGGRASPFILTQDPNYPASGLMFLWPYAALDWPTARVLWALSNLLFTALMVFVLSRFFPPGARAESSLWLGALFLMGTPWRVTVSNGQHPLFALAFFLLAFHLLRSKRRGSGLSLAASWFKWSLAFPLSLVFGRFGRRGLGIVLAAAAAHAALTLFAAAWTHASVVSLLTGPLRVAQITTRPGEVDVFAVLRSLGFESRLLGGALALAVLGVSFAAVARDRDALSALSTLALTSLVVVYHLIYDFVVLVIPLAYVLRDQARHARGRYYAVVIAFMWFADRAAQSVLSLPMAADRTALAGGYFWLKASIVYAALFGDWINAFRGGCFERARRDG
jgi:hypothetical protein